MNRGKLLEKLGVEEVTTEYVIGTSIVNIPKNIKTVGSFKEWLFRYANTLEEIYGYQTNISIDDIIIETSFDPPVPIDD